MTARELRDMAGLTYSTPITAPEYHAERAEIAKTLMDEGRILPIATRTGGAGKPRRLSLAAKAKNRQKLADHDAIAGPEQRIHAAQASASATALRLWPEYEQAIATYDAVVAETGKRYGALPECAKRLGWPERKVQLRVKAAWRHGLGSPPPRSSEEERTCEVCGSEFIVSRTKGWTNHTCSAACGRRRRDSGCAD